MRYNSNNSNTVDETQNQSYLVNNESNYGGYSGNSYINNSQTTIDNQNCYKGNQKYKVISNGVTNNNVKIPKKNKDIAKQISINISEQSPSNFKKMSSSSLIRNASDLSSKDGSYQYEKNSTSPISSPDEKNFKGTNFSGINLKKFSLIDLLQNSSSPQGNDRPLFMMDFLKQRIGKEKFNNLINKIEESENPYSLLEDETQIKEIVGENYQLAINFLKYVMKAIQTSQKSIPRTKSESDFR